MAKQIIIKGTPVVGANEVLVADSNSKIPAVDASAVTTMAGGNITGTIPTARLDTGTTANKVVVVGASGLPAVDGSLLTGIVSYTKSASDPTISTNPSGGVGTEWVNHTTGKQFICTDATAGANVWKCSGGGSGDIVPYNFGGTTYGFMVGDYNDPSITRFSFTSDGNGTDWGDIAGTTGQSQAKSSGSDKDNGYGYTAGGSAGGAAGNEIARFSMVSSGGSTDVGDLTQTTAYGMSVGNATHAWSVGHEYNGGGGGNGNVISRFAFTSSNNATDWGDLTRQTYGGGGASNGDGSYGYAISGGGPNTTNIEKFALTSASNATDIGDATVALHSSAGTSSATYGYRSGGYPASNVIDKVSFSTDGNATDVGDLTISVHQRAGSSSTTYGYTCGGVSSNDTIEKHSFSSDGNATDVGNLSYGQIAPAGCQV